MKEPPELSPEDKELVDRLDKFIKTVYQYAANFAKETGIPAAQISRYLSGENKPTSPNMRLFEQLGGLSASWLVTGQGDMFSLTPKGRELRKKHVGKELPQTVGEAENQERGEWYKQQVSARWGLVREWLTETGSITEWYFRVIVIEPTMTLNRLIELETIDHNLSIPPESEKFYAWIAASGIELNWIFCTDVRSSISPFTQNEQGEALRQRLYERYGVERYSETITY